MYICIKHTYVYTVHLLLHACHFRDILKMKTCKNKGLRKKKVSYLTLKILIFLRSHRCSMFSIYNKFHLFPEKKKFHYIAHFSGATFPPPFTFLTIPSHNRLTLYRTAK